MVAVIAKDHRGNDRIIQASGVTHVVEDGNMRAVGMLSAANIIAVHGVGDMPVMVEKGSNIINEMHADKDRIVNTFETPSGALVHVDNAQRKRRGLVARTLFPNAPIRLKSGGKTPAVVRSTKSLSQRVRVALRHLAR